ncbi:MAG: hypothetical protein GY759_19130 [Chloroflexi bacterium]|nr:hypothetical protein [Chloroflexota bacterium]
MSDQTQAESLAFEITDLEPDPFETWRRLQAFLGLDDEKVIRAMRRTSETLLRDAAQFVVDTYNYLSQFDETAAVLGWEHGMDEKHLAERRQFFSTWIARTIGVDLSEEFADYLYQAGKIHAGHGPRQIHTPDLWVMGSVAVVQSYFARRIIEDGHDPQLAAAAIGGWNSYLMLQARQMLAGYQVAVALDEGSVKINVRLYGQLRDLINAGKIPVHVHTGATIHDALRKVFNYYPPLRRELLQAQWQTPDEAGDATWITDLERVYKPKGGPHSHTLLNGHDVRDRTDLDKPLKAGDAITLFPPWVTYF